MSEFIQVRSEGGSMRSYVARPERPNGAGVVLSSSVWGINSDLVAIADYLAALGYAVIAPNLFWRLTEHHGIDYDFERIQEVLDLEAGSTDENGVVVLNRALDVLKETSGCRRAGVVGWCYGGRIACLLATEDRFDAVAGVYPTRLETRLDIAPNIRCPLSLHLSEIEQWATVEDAAEQIQHAFGADPQVEMFMYRGVKHGFDFGPPHPNFNHPAARLCDARVALFLERVLVGRA